MADEAQEQVNRRSFLKAAAATAAAATVTGAGAALLYERAQQGPVIAPPAPSPAVETVQTVAQNSGELSAMMQRLAAAQAENMRLQAQLSTVQQQLTAAHTAATEQNSAAADASQRQLSEANGQIISLTDQIGILSGLVALYEQLDAIALGSILNGGLATVDMVLDGLRAQLPGVDEGLSVGREALEAFEAEVPMMDSGRRWLNAQVAKLQGYYQGVEEALQNAVDRTGSVIQMLGEWFESMLSWLPFGMGDKAARTMDSLTSLLGEVPATLSGLQTNLAQPLDMWLAEENGEVKLERRLIKPIRDQALSRAAEAVSQVQFLEAAYKIELAQPAREADQRQEAIRELIAQYRQQNQV